jgi:hypothetical protein
MTELFELPIALGAKPALATVAIPVTNAAPNINDRTIVSSRVQRISRPLDCGSLGAAA